MQNLPPNLLVGGRGEETREVELQGCSLSEMRVASTGGKLGVQATSSAAAAALLLMRHQATHLLALPLPPSLSRTLPLVLIFIFIQVFSLSLLELDTELSWALPSLLHSPPLSPSLFLLSLVACKQGVVV